MIGMTSFLRKCPAIESFNIHETIRLSDEIMRLIFTTLQRLKHFRMYNEFEEDSLRRRDRPWVDITKGCRELQVNFFIFSLFSYFLNLKKNQTELTRYHARLQSLRIIDSQNHIDVKYHLFKRIRSLKVIWHANHDIMTRASCFSIQNYVKAIGIPYSKLGKLQDIIERYSDDEYDFAYEQPL